MKYEYRAVYKRHMEAFELLANKMGKDGWRWVNPQVEAHQTKALMIFEREVGA